jgi:hypothetical protein
MEREAAITVANIAGAAAVPIGLTSAEAVRRRTGFGLNMVSEEAPPPWRRPSWRWRESCLSLSGNM